VDFDTERAAVENVRVDHGRGHVAVPKQFLDRGAYLGGLAAWRLGGPDRKSASREKWV
jgi:hypothetical protein